MTTMALIAGSLPIALGLNEASRQRTSMGYAIIGGLYQLHGVDAFSWFLRRSRTSTASEFGRAVRSRGYSWPEIRIMTNQIPKARKKRSLRFTESV